MANFHLRNTHPHGDYVTLIPDNHHTTMRRNFTLTLALLIAAAATASAQEPTDTPATPPAGGRAGGAITPPPSDPQPYDKVITKEAKSKAGIFTVHQVKDKYYYEIPKSELGKDFLWVSQIAKTTNGVGYGGQALANRVVRWERSGNKINLRDVNYEVVADAKKPIAAAVAAANNSSILMTFPIAAFGKENKDGKDTTKENHTIIEVTRLFSTEVQEIGARTRLQATALDATRSSIERISAFPTNIEAEASMTYTRMATPSGVPQTPANPFLGAGMRPGSATVVLHHSMVKLPENPMKPRLYDDRVGYFTRRQMDYSVDEQRAPERRFITRWRLEKKDPSAAVSEPVKQIVYYIDSATPSKYVPYMKAGIESWQKAFEAAGFKNAIIAKLAPTPAEDPDFSAEDARYSVIRWLPSTIENASGPNVNDPRTGEILESDIQFYHNVMNLARMWYFVQSSPLDPKAQKFPLPDDLMGKLVQYVCAHEVGHTLGFQHNMKASSQYPQEKVRDRDWVHKMGHSPSIMDYSRYNYVAQPEDKIDPADLIPQVGPYDIWATHWGYAPIADEDEKLTLDKWAREQDSTPWYRFSTAHAAGSDPGDLTEAVGDADAVKSTALGLKNLERVAKNLIPATTGQQGENYDLLAEVYGRVLGQWSLEMGHVAAIVGGFDSQQKNIGQNGILFTPVSRARQAEAVKFLTDNAFNAPKWMIDPQILRRIEAVGELSRIRGAQVNVMNNMLNSARFARLVEQEAMDATNAYTPSMLLADIRKGVWKELDAPQVKVDAYRRNLQRAYLELANGKINGSSAAPAGLPAAFAGMFATSGDEAPMYRAELKALNATLASVRAVDGPTRAHVDAARDQIAKILDPKFQAANAAAAAVRVFGLNDQETCWPDYIILP